jgi:hypothetical protein
MRTLHTALAVAAVAVAVAGCGSSNDSGTTASGTSAPEAWASDLCSAVTTYRTALQSAGDSLKSGGVTRSALSDAADDVTTATDSFVDDLDGLGKPDTDAGAQAKQSVDGLSSDLKTSKDEIEKATEDVSTLSEVLTAVSTVSATLANATTQISETWNALQQLDAKDELSQAFASSDSCEELN